MVLSSDQASERETHEQLFESRERCGGLLSLRALPAGPSFRETLGDGGYVSRLRVRALPLSLAMAAVPGDPRRRKERQLWGGPGARVGRYHPRASKRGARR